MMPRSIEPITFSITGSGLTRLPQNFDSGRCRVKVSMQEGMTEAQSSWLWINVNMDRIMLTCASHDYPGRGGGTIEFDGIKIETVKLPRAEAGGKEED